MAIENIPSHLELLKARLVLHHTYRPQVKEPGTTIDGIYEEIAQAALNIDSLVIRSREIADPNDLQQLRSSIQELRDTITNAGQDITSCDLYNDMLYEGEITEEDARTIFWQRANGYLGITHTNSSLFQINSESTNNNNEFYCFQCDNDGYTVSMDYIYKDQPLEYTTRRLGWSEMTVDDFAIGHFVVEQFLSGVQQSSSAY